MSDSLSFDAFAYKDGQLFVEDAPLSRIADEFGTPCFVYSRQALTRAFASFDRPFGSRSHLICYAVKANSNLAILQLFARQGSGFDIVSAGELARVLKAGVDPQRVVFSGVGKSADEIKQALAAGILCFNVESRGELLRLSRLAQDARTTAALSLRVNPDVDPKTHPYISTGLKNNKFGVSFESAAALYREASRLPAVRIVGIDCHIGSQITEIPPFVDAVRKLLRLVDDLRADGIELEHFDLGGGLGIRYRNEAPPAVSEYVRALLEELGERPQRILLEPGRALVGNAGLLLTRVEYLKEGPERNFVIVDAAMNDLLRPALYEAWHDILPARQPLSASTKRFEVVGPVCESADFLGHDRDLAVESGDLLAVMSAGAYGMAMSSNYNTRARAAEVLVDRGRTQLIRARETIDAMLAPDRLLDE
jgi:diaminopimelate decarboxylase